jgi:hypothetical protein
LRISREAHRAGTVRLIANLATQVSCNTTYLDTLLWLFCAVSWGYLWRESARRNNATSALFATVTTFQSSIGETIECSKTVVVPYSKRDRTNHNGANRCSCKRLKNQVE